MASAFLSACLVCAHLVGDTELPPNPPLPSPTAPGAVSSPQPAASSGSSDRVDIPAIVNLRPPAVPKLKLGEKKLNDEPRQSGVGLILKGVGEAKVAGNRLDAKVSGASASHIFPLVPHSELHSTVQLVQEFDILPGAPSETWAKLTMAGKLDGYLRAEAKGMAWLHRADAVLLREGVCQPDLSVAFPPSEVSGWEVIRCTSETTAPALIVPTGHYILVVTLVLETKAAGLFRSHAESVFTSGRWVGTWMSDRDPRSPSSEEWDDFGLAISLKVDPAPAH